ncbi:MAG: RcnB family protein [Caulobacterales bacterium]
MKKLAIMAVAAISGLAPILATPAAADPHDRAERRHERREDRWDRREDRRDDRYDRREDRRDRRDDRREARWDRRHHNGYSYNGNWYYGPPPAAYYGRPGYNPGYRAWRRGDRLPSYYRSSYAAVDYHRHRGLYAPPRGYHWVRDNDRGDYLLVGIATGVILGAILAH